MEKVRVFLGSSTGRLSLTYLGIIMTMSIGFSIVLFSESSSQLGRHLPPPAYTQRFNLYLQNQLNDDTTPVDINQFLQERISEGRRMLLGDIIALNILVLIAGAAISYFLARRTLAPIEAAIASKDRFVSDASHELRTPLTALRTTNEVALRKSKLSLKEAKSLIGENIMETKRLQKLTDSLLGLLKESGGQRPRTTFNLQELVSESMGQVVATAQAKKVTVEDKIPNVMLSTQRDVLLEIVTIILENAVKYSHDKGTVELTAETNDHQLLLRVRDEGVGIKAVDMPHIFERFYRADNARSKQATNGYGLGLAIAKQRIGLLGGTIHAESQAGKGSVFEIRLPL